MNDLFWQDVKLSTLEVHQRLEKSLTLMQPQSTLLDYYHYLMKMYGFYVTHEQLLLSIASDFFNVRQKKQWFINDFKQLNIDYHTLPLFPAAFKNKNQALGCAYVLEGSTLGGIVIMQSLKQKWPDLNAYDYLSGYGKQTHQQWLLFKEWVDMQAPQKDEFIQGAIDTFLNLEYWLTQSDHQIVQLSS